MKLLEKILLAVDFTDQNNKYLIETAIYLSGNFNSHLTLLNVIPGRTDDEVVINYLQKSASDEMAKISKTMEEAGVSHESRIVRGNPFMQIVEIAEKDEFNVILLGAGNSGKSTNTPSSKVRKLIRETNIPVWVIKKKSHKGFKRILCPVNFSESSKRALRNAILIASKMNASLKLISVYEPIEIISGRISADLDEYNNIAYADYSKQFENFLSEFNLRNIDFSKAVLSGNPENKILEELNTSEYDLLLMGTTGRTGLSRIFTGSVTEKVIEESPVSFITTKNRDILNTEFELKLDRIETLLNEAGKNMKNGNYADAAHLYENCLAIDPFLLPAVQGASKAYKKAGKPEKAGRFDHFEEEIRSRLWKKSVPEDQTGFL